jgi:hypothetical protein
VRRPPASHAFLHAVDHSPITGSGKSVWTYRLLTQLAASREAIIAGLDPSGLLFRPFVGSKHAEWQVSGVADPEAFAKLLRRLVDEMDYRIRHLRECLINGGFGLGLMR